MLHSVRRRKVTLSYVQCGHYGQQETGESKEKHQFLYIKLAGGRRKWQLILSILARHQHTL